MAFLLSNAEHGSIITGTLLVLRPAGVSGKIWADDNCGRKNKLVRFDKD